MLSSVYVFQNECILRFSSEMPQAGINAIRRSLMLDLRTQAVDNVTMKKNVSVFPCELIAQRLSLVPIVKECQSMTLDAIGPCEVTSDMVLDKDNKEQVLVPGIMILKLAEGQCVSLSANTKISTAREHARYSPVACMSLKKCSVSNSSMEKECWCGANFIPHEQVPNKCTRCNYKKYGDNEVEYVLSFKTVNGKNPISCVHDSIALINANLNLIKSS